MSICLLGLAAVMEWWKPTDPTLNFIETTEEASQIRLFENTEPTPIAEPAWQLTLTLTRRVEEILELPQETPPPSWGEKFATLSDNPVNLSVSGGGETVPGHHYIVHFLNFDREQGAETWFYREPPHHAFEATARSRRWETFVSVTHRFGRLTYPPDPVGPVQPW